MVGRPHTLLVGLPGSGKTTVGRHLAAWLKLSFIDFDDYIERRFDKSVSSIFAEHGEQAFRTAEALLSQELAATWGYVLSPGGGWITNSEAVAHLRPVSRIIYLRVSPKVALERLGQAIVTRPLLAAGDPTKTLQLLYNVRRVLYEEVADMTIETDHLSREALLTTAVELVASAGT